MVEEIAAKSKVEVDKLRELYERECEKVEKLKSFVREQEKQCDALANHIKTLDKERDEWRELAEKRSNEVQELRQKATSSESKLSESNRMFNELNRYKDKASFLEVGCLLGQFLYRILGLLNKFIKNSAPN